MNTMRLAGYALIGAGVLYALRSSPSAGLPSSSFSVANGTLDFGTPSFPPADVLDTSGALQPVASGASPAAPASDAAPSSWWPTGGAFPDNFGPGGGRVAAADGLYYAPGTGPFRMGD